MKTSHRLLLASLVAVSSAFAQETAKYPLHASASAVVAFMGDFKTSVGGGVTVGTTFKKNHVLELEVDAVQSTTKDSYVDLDIVPVLLNYRYQTEIARNTTGYLGVSAGVTFEKATVYWGHPSDTAFTGGLKMGVQWQVAKGLDLDVGASVLRLTETDVTTSGSIELVSVGLKYRF